MLEDLQADGVLALAADVLLEPGDRLQVVVEDLGRGREDESIAAVSPSKSGVSTSIVAPVRRADRQDAAAEVVGAAVGQVVAGDRRDHDVLQPEPGAGLGQAVGLVGGDGLGLAARARRRSRRGGCRRRPGP